jgi:aspartyl/asparaginyl-tRNA synthetase
MRNTQIYHELVQKMRAFFLQKGFIEVPTQSRLSILAACENPHSITTFNYSGEVWPLPQTGQMWLEHELLNNPEWPGCFCISTSYRQEKNPIPGRHSLIFPMFEVESKGTIQDLIKLESELLKYLGFDEPMEVNYDDICQKYDVINEDLIFSDKIETETFSGLRKTIVSEKLAPYNTYGKNAGKKYIQETMKEIGQLPINIGSIKKWFIVTDKKQNKRTLPNLPPHTRHTLLPPPLFRPHLPSLQ